MSRPRGACVLTERGSTATWLFIGACHRSMHRNPTPGTVGKHRRTASTAATGLPVALVDARRDYVTRWCGVSTECVVVSSSRV